MDFDFFLSTFPSDEIFENEPAATFHSKIGEATYSEVFGCGSMVLKIIPLRNPELAGLESEVSEEELPTFSDIAEVEREIITTRALGEFSKGFVRLIK
jgi:serine/threonine-protein kinase haspin